MAEHQYGLSSSNSGKNSYKWLYLPFMILLALAGMSYATQDIAAFYGYQPVLGEPWFVWNGIPWYAPWAVFQWSSQWPDQYGQFNISVTIGQAIFLVPQFIILGFWFARRKLKGNQDLHGSAKWATEEDIHKMGYLKGGGVYVGGWLKEYSSGEQVSRIFRWLFRLLFFPFLLLKLGLVRFLRSLEGGRFDIILYVLFASLLVYRKNKKFDIAFYLRKPEQKVHYYLRHDGPEHIMAFAPTRSGKGIGLILPTLLAWEGSSLVLDIKGENWALTAGYCKSQGNTVLRFDPSDSTGASAGFNPLEEMRLDTLMAIQDVQSLALMFADGEGKGLSDHWTKAAFSFFSGMILHCCVMIPHTQEGRPANPQDLILMMADESRTTEELLTEMLETDHAEILKSQYPNSPTVGQAADAIHTFIASSAREMLNKDEKEASGVLSSAAVNMSLYRDPIVTLNTSRSDFHIHDLMNSENPVNLYLVVSPSDIDRVKPLMRLIVDMIIRRVCAKMEFADGSSVAGYKHRLLFMLDEFTSLGKLPIVEKAIAYIAGYGGKMYIIVQDTVQLDKEYGKENAIMSNCHVRIAYAPNKIETAKLLSEMLGKTTVVETKTSLSGSRTGSMKNASLSVSETARPLLTPDECMKLPGLTKNASGQVVPGKMLIFTAGHPTILGTQILYFQDPVFSERAKVKVPGLSRAYPSGITDSLYYPRPAEWYTANASDTSGIVSAEEVIKEHEDYVMDRATQNTETAKDLEDYFQ